MTYDFLIASYDSERIKILSVWSEFRDDDLPVRPKPDDPRGRSVHEHMVHQCVSEDNWFRNMLGVDVGPPPLPEREDRLDFISWYAEDGHSHHRGQQMAMLRMLGRALHSNCRLDSEVWTAAREGGAPALRQPMCRCCRPSGVRPSGVPRTRRSFQRSGPLSGSQIPLCDLGRRPARLFPLRTVRQGCLERKRSLLHGELIGTRSN